MSGGISNRHDMNFLQGDIVMIEKIVIGIFAVVVFGAAVALWWFENGPSRDKDDNESEVS